MGNPVYRLPINKRSCYAIELYPGCSDCEAAPGIIVRKLDSTSDSWDELQEAPVFPFSKVCDYTEGAIKCGRDPGEFRKDVVALISGVEVEDRKIDDVAADDMAETIWNESLRVMPEVIEYAKPAESDK